MLGQDCPSCKNQCLECRCWKSARADGGTAAEEENAPLEQAKLQQRPKKVLQPLKKNQWCKKDDLAGSSDG